MKRFLCIVLLLMLVLSSVPAYAAHTAVQDGMSVTLITDKDVYAAGEPVEAVLRVQNLHDADIRNVRTEIKAPHNVRLMGGGKARLPHLKAHETHEHTDVLHDGSTPDLPHTGDSAPIGLWLALLTLSFAGCVCLVAIRRPKAGSRWLSLLLCVVLVGSGLPAHVHAETQDKTITVSKQVTVDGQPTDITGTVTYSADVAVLTVANYMINEMAEDIKVHVGDMLTLSGVITAPADALLSGVQVLIYEENEEEPYTVGEEYFSFAPAAMQYDLALVPQMIVGEPFGESEFALMEGGRYVVMLRAADSKGSAFADSDAEAEGLQGPQLSLRVLADPANCDHSSKEYTYERDYATASRVTYTGSDTSHLVEPAYKRYCADCGTFLMNIWGEGEEAWHTMKDGMCTECGYTVEAVTYADAHTVCNHEGATSRLLTTNVFHSDSEFHTRQELYSTTCSECALGTNNILTIETQEAHVFDENGICTICNYVQSAPCAHDWLETVIVTHSSMMHKYDENHNEIESTEHRVSVLEQLVCVLCKAVVHHEQTGYLEEHSYDSNGMCESCGYNPEITCLHRSTSADAASVVGYEQIEGSVSKHYVIKTRTEQRCLNCGITLPANDYSKVAEFHVFEDGVCACGAIEQPCEHPSTTATFNPAGLSGFSNVTETHHDVIKTYVDLCDECGQPVGNNYYRSNTEEHTYINDACACGATKAPEAETPSLSISFQNGNSYLYIFNLTTEDASSATLYFEQDGAVVHSVDMTSVGSGAFTTNYIFNSVGNKKIYAITDAGVTSNIITLDITVASLQPTLLPSPVLYQNDYSVKTNEYLEVRWYSVEYARYYEIQIYKDDVQESYYTLRGTNDLFYFSEEGDYRLEIIAKNGDIASKPAIVDISVTYAEASETDDIQLRASEKITFFGKTIDFEVTSDTDEIKLIEISHDSATRKVHSLERDSTNPSLYTAAHSWENYRSSDFFVLAADGRKSNTVTVTWDAESEPATSILTATLRNNSTYLFTLTSDNSLSATLFFMQDGAPEGFADMDAEGYGVFSLTHTFSTAGTKDVYALFDDGTTSSTVTLEITEDMLQPSSTKLATPVLHQTNYSVKTNETFTLSWDAVPNATSYFVSFPGGGLSGSFTSETFYFDEPGTYEFTVTASGRGYTGSDAASATVVITQDDPVESEQIRLTASATNPALGDPVTFSIISDTAEMQVIVSDEATSFYDVLAGDYIYSIDETHFEFGFSSYYENNPTSFFVLTSDGRKSNTVTVTWSGEGEVITPTLTATHQGNGEYLFNLTTNNAYSATLYFKQDGAVVHSINMSPAAGGTFTTNYTFNSVGTKNVYAITDDGVTSNILTLDITEDMLQPTTPTLATPVLHQTSYSVKTNQYVTITCDEVENAESYHISIYNKESYEFIRGYGTGGSPSFFLHFTEAGDYRIEVYARNGDIESERATATVSVTHEEITETDTIHLSASKTKAALGEAVDFTVISDTDEIVLVYTSSSGAFDSKVHNASDLFYFDSAYHAGCSFNFSETITFFVLSSDGRKSNTVTVTWGDESEVITPTLTATHQGNGEYLFNLTTDHASSATLYFEQDGAVVHSINMTSAAGGTFTTNYTFNSVGTKNVYAITDDDVTSNILTLDITEDMLNPTLDAPTITTSDHSAVAGEPDVINWTAVDGAEGYTIAVYKNKQTVTSDCTISYNGCSASIIFPSEGVYVVQAAAKKDGYNAAWSNGVNVTVTEAEPEEEVELSVSDDEVEIGDTLVITATTNADSVTLVMTAEDGSASTVAMTQSAAGTFVHRLSASSAQSLTLHAVTPNGTESNKVTVTIYCPHTSSTDTYNPNIQPVYSNITETHHDVSSGYTPLCDECGEPTGANGYFDAVTQEHTFEDGVCVCGASEKPAEDKLAAPVPAQASMTTIRGEQVTIRWNASAGAERYGVWFYDTNPATYVDAGTNLYVTHTFEHNSPQGAPFSVQVYALAGTGADQQQSEPGVISVTVECGEHDYSDALVYTNTLFKPVDDEYHLAYADVYSVTCTECGATNPAYTIERDPEDYEQDKHAYDAKGVCQSDGCGHECGHKFEDVLDEDGGPTAVPNTGVWESVGEDGHVCTSIQYYQKCAYCGAEEVRTEDDPYDGEVQGHTYDSDEYDSDASEHWLADVTCNGGCGYVRPDLRGEHEYENGKCVECGRTYFYVTITSDKKYPVPSPSYVEKNGEFYHRVFVGTVMEYSRDDDSAWGNWYLTASNPSVLRVYAYPQKIEAIKAGDCIITVNFDDKVVQTYHFEVVDYTYNDGEEGIIDTRLPNTNALAAKQIDPNILDFIDNFDTNEYQLAHQVLENEVMKYWLQQYGSTLALHWDDPLFMIKMAGEAIGDAVQGDSRGTQYYENVLIQILENIPSESDDEFKRAKQNILYCEKLLKQVPEGKEYQVLRDAILRVQAQNLSPLSTKAHKAMQEGQWQVIEEIDELKDKLEYGEEIYDFIMSDGASNSLILGGVKIVVDSAFYYDKKELEADLTASYEYPILMSYLLLMEESMEEDMASDFVVQQDLEQSYDMWRGAQITLNEMALGAGDKANRNVNKQLNAEINQLENMSLDEWRKNSYYDPNFYVVPDSDFESTQINELAKKNGGFTAKWNELSASEKEVVRSTIDDINSFTQNTSGTMQLYLIEQNDIVIRNSNGQMLFISKSTVGEKVEFGVSRERAIDNQIILPDFVSVDGNVSIINDEVRLRDIVSSTTITEQQLAELLSEDSYKDMLKAAQKM